MSSSPILPSDVFLGLLFLVVIAITVTGGYFVFTDVPYVRTPRRIAEEMVEVAMLRDGQRLYDLGAGDGQLLVMAKCACPGITAVGYELVPTVWMLGRLHLWWTGTDARLLRANALKQDMHDADVIFLYLMPHVLAKLESKFDAELRAGTRVVSHTFRFPNRQPVKEVTIPWRRRDKKILVYEW